MPLSKAILKSLSERPGIYKMKDAEDTVLYVGKAKNLRSRVSQYFQKDYQHSTRTRKLLESAAELAFIETDTELEALILETTLIKELRPKYNILMKDDKSYVYIKIDMGEDFPRIRVVRERDMKSKARGDKAKYFGPKLASGKVYETLRILKKLFPFRHCNLDIVFNPGTKNLQPTSYQLPLSSNKDLVTVTNRVIDFPCLDYFIKRCPGPCIGAIAPNEYKKIVQQIIDFLSGKSDELERSLHSQMQEAASQKLFEKAAKIRDKLYAISSITEHQKVSDPERVDTDVINFTADMGRIYFNVFMIRGGKLINQENFMLDAFAASKETNETDDAETLSAFLTQYYEKAADIPKEILIPQPLEDVATLEKWLTQGRGSHVTILNPQKGEKNKLLELSLKNAVSFAKQYRIKWLAQERGETALARLSEVLGMKDKVLKRIEGYDISHLGGNETVGSMVVFENGASKSDHYRHFKMRTVVGKPDDYKSMEEVLMRRLKYLQKNEGVKIKKARKKDSDTIKSWGIALKWRELIKTPDWENFYLIWGKPTVSPTSSVSPSTSSGSTLAPLPFGGTRSGPTRPELVPQESQILKSIKDKPVGMARLIEIKKGIFMAEAIYITPENRGGRLSYAFMEKLIGSIKNKKARLYISVEDHLLDHWLAFGFTHVQNAPPEVMKRNTFFEKLDTTNYTVLAYYKAQKKTADPSFGAKPDLIVVDGGKGQLGTAILVLKRLQLQIPVISLAKRLEEIYLPGEKAPMLLEEGDEALKLLQRIRDESHRFAITFQRELHRKNLLK